MSRFLINAVLLLAAAVNIAFIIRYTVLSNWRQTFLGRNVLTQKIEFAVVCLLFPIGYYIHNDSGSVFEWIQVVVIAALLITFMVDYMQLRDSQKRREHEEPYLSRPKSLKRPWWLKSNR